MAANPYAAPQSSLKDPEDVPKFQFSVPLIGMLAATGAAYCLNLLYGNLAQWALLSRGVPLNDLYNSVAGSPLHNLVGHSLNILATAVVGHWIAKLHPQRAFSHGVVAGVLIWIPVTIGWVNPYDMPHPAWSVLLTYLTPIPAVLLGVLWFRRRA
jgi:hypothetical protein